MFTRKVFFKSATRVSKQTFSTGKAEGSKTVVGKALEFVKNHRQQLVNIVGIYLVVSFGVHNFRVQKAWEQQQLDAKQLKAENEALKTSLLNKEWTAGVEEKIRASKPVQNVLQSELEAYINSTIASITDAEGKLSQATTSVAADPLSKALEAELSSVGSVPAGVKVSSSDSGRVI